MFWLCTVFFAGMVLSFGWKVGTIIMDYMIEFINDCPDGIRKIKRYRKKRRDKYINVKYFKDWEKL